MAYSLFDDLAAAVRSGAAAARRAPRRPAWLRPRVTDTPARAADGHDAGRPAEPLAEPTAPGNETRPAR